MVPGVAWVGMWRKSLGATWRKRARLDNFKSCRDQPLPLQVFESKKDILPLVLAGRAERRPR